MAPRKLPSLKNNIAVLPPIESEYLSRVPGIVGFVGSTGSGKTHLALSLIKLMRREHSISKLYVITPTFDSNVIYKSVVKDTDWVYTGSMKDVFKALQEVELDCAAISENYRQKLEHQLVLHRFIAGETLLAPDEQLLELYGFEVAEPRRPSPLLLLDDMSHSPIFSNSRLNPLTALVLRSRHVGDGLGLSIFLVAQNSRGIPKPLRLNFTHLFIWATQSQKEIQSFYEEAGGIVSYKHFEDIFRAYTMLPHSYLFVDNIRRTLSDSF